MLPVIVHFFLAILSFETYASICSQDPFKQGASAIETIDIAKISEVVNQIRKQQHGSLPTSSPWVRILVDADQHEFQQEVSSLQERILRDANFDYAYWLTLNLDEACDYIAAYKDARQPVVPRVEKEHVVIEMRTAPVKKTPPTVKPPIKPEMKPMQARSPRQVQRRASNSFPENLPITPTRHLLFEIVEKEFMALGNKEFSLPESLLKNIWSLPAREQYLSGMADATIENWPLVEESQLTDLYVFRTQAMARRLLFRFNGMEILLPSAMKLLAHTGAESKNLSEDFERLIVQGRAPFELPGLLANSLNMKRRSTVVLKEVMKAVDVLQSYPESVQVRTFSGALRELAREDADYISLVVLVEHNIAKKLRELPIPSSGMAYLSRIRKAEVLEDLASYRVVSGSSVYEFPVVAKPLDLWDLRVEMAVKTAQDKAVERNEKMGDSVRVVFDVDRFGDRKWVALREKAKNNILEWLPFFTHSDRFIGDGVIALMRQNHQYFEELVEKHTVAVVSEIRATNSNFKCSSSSSIEAVSLAVAIRSLMEWRQIEIDNILGHEVFGKAEPSVSQDFTVHIWRGLSRIIWENVSGTKIEDADFEIRLEAAKEALRKVLAEFGNSD